MANKKKPRESATTSPDPAIAAAPGIFHIFLNNGPTIGWVKNPLGRYVYVNTPFLKHINPKNNDILGKEDSEWMPPALALIQKEHDRMVLESGETMEFIEPFPSNAGGTREWLVFKFIIDDGSGRRMLGGLGADIHERRQAERRLESQYAVTRAFAEAESLQDICGRLLETLCRSFAWHFGAIWLPEPADGSLRCLEIWHDPILQLDDLVASTRVTADRTRNVADIQIGLPQDVLASRALVWVQNLSASSASERTSLAIEAGMTSGFAYPIKKKDRVIGVAEFYSLSPHSLNMDMLNMLESITNQMRQFIERRRAEVELTQRTALLEAVSRVQSKFISDADSSEIYAAVLADLLYITNSEYGFIGEVEIEPHRLEVLSALSTVSAWNPSGGDTNLRPRYESSMVMEEQTVEYLFQTIALTGRPVGSNRILNDAVRTRTRGRSAHCFIALPLKRGHKLVGIAAIARPDPYESGIDQFLQPLIGTAAMIIEAARTARQRRSMEDAIRERENRLRAVLDAAPESIMTVTRHGTIESANRATQTLFGCKPEELIGDAIEYLVSELRIFNLCKDTDDLRRRLSRDGFLSSPIELEAHRKDGSSFPAEVTVREVHFADRVTFSIIVRDISERKEVERRVSEFYSTVSHELRTPLTSIRGSIGLIEGGVFGETSSEMKDFLGIALSNCDHLMTLINDILDLRKIEADKLELELTSINPSEVIESTVESLNVIAAAKNMELSCHCNTEQLFIGDRHKVQRILNNLISNAIKFSPEGSPVRVIADVGSDGYVRFSVVDEGPGIPASQHYKLFGKFQQLDSSDTRQKGGTGLGLAICKALVELHSGRIGFDSTVGKGSTFWVELPITLQSRETKEHA